MLDPTRGAATETMLSRLIRNEASRRGRTVVHLGTRAPFPLGLMLGRRLNTLELTQYECKSTAHRATYVPTLTVAPGRGQPALRVRRAALS